MNQRVRLSDDILANLYFKSLNFDVVSLMHQVLFLTSHFKILYLSCDLRIISDHLFRISTVMIASKSHRHHQMSGTQPRFCKENSSSCSRIGLPLTQFLVATKHTSQTWQSTNLCLGNNIQVAWHRWALVVSQWCERREVPNSGIKRYLWYPLFTSEGLCVCNKPGKTFPCTFSKHLTYKQHVKTVDECLKDGKLLHQKLHFIPF